MGKDKVPNLWMMILLEIFLTVCLVIMVIFTIFMIFGKKKYIKEMWEPYATHFQLWKWSYQRMRDPNLPNDVFHFIDIEAERQKAKRPHKQWHRPKIYVSPEDFFLAIIGTIYTAYGAFYIALLVVFIVAVCAGVPIAYVVNQNAPAPQPTTTTQTTIRITEQMQQVTDLGPFVGQKDAGQLRTKSGVNNFALISDTGSIRYSQQWTLDPDDPNWAPSASPYIQNFNISGTSVSFTDDRGSNFVLNTIQPFEFENKAFLVFMFKSGKLWQMQSTKMSKKSVNGVKSDAAANPQLSIL